MHSGMTLWQLLENQRASRFSSINPAFNQKIRRASNQCGGRWEPADGVRLIAREADTGKQHWSNASDFAIMFEMPDLLSMTTPARWPKRNSSANSEGKDRTGRPRLRNRLSSLFLALSVFVLVTFLYSHWVQPDWMMYSTIVPVFLWLTVGLITTVCIKHRPQARRVMFLAWALAGIALSDSPQNILRQFLPQDSRWISARHNQAEQTSKIPLRIISLNCKGESSAISELWTLRPDVVLLQESPSRQELNKVLETHFPDYSLSYSHDTAVLVRGQSDPLPIEKTLSTRCQFSKVTLENGASFHVVSLHLINSPRRLDFWNPETWSLFAELNKTRRRQLLDIRGEIGSTIGNNPTIIGGDFNAPAGNKAYDYMKTRFVDSWTQAGRGWGKSSLNDVPIHRIDQIWLTKDFEAVSVTAKKSERSDHRAVICDAWLNKTSQSTPSSQFQTDSE